ncbi:MAG: GAF domain-containing protein [Chloroflexia bacterium]|nr:GAF domain-containing protein [Chloroflexia bacterium]
MNELLSTHNEQEIINWGLEEAVRLSDSHIGFFHYVNDDQNTISLQTWSKETLQNCNVPEKTEHYPISEAGTWVDSFHQKKPVIHNDYQSLPHKKGLPQGHFPLFRYISLPVIEEDKVKIIFGVGNKRDNYTQFDADILSLLAKTIWMVIQRKRVEHELKESNTAKDKFLSIISHDLRSPIGSIQGLTEALLENLDSFGPDEILNFIDTIHKTVSGTYNLVDNMLIWAQNHRNKIEFSPQVVVLKELIDNAVHVELTEADKKILQ